MSGCMITGLVIFAALVLIAILASLAVPIYNRVRERAAELSDTQRQKRTKELAVPLTPEEKTQAEAFAARLLKAIEEEDLAGVKTAVDYTELTEEVFAGLNSTPEMKRGFINGVEKAAGGLFSGVLGQQGHFVRHHTREGIPVVTLRFVGEGSGASYTDLFLKRDGAGSFKCVDLYNYLFGTQVTTESRRAVAMMLNSDSSTLSKILGLPLKVDQHIVKAFTDVTQSFNAGDHNAVIRRYETMQPELQDLAFLYAMYVQSLQTACSTDPGLNDKYTAALGKARGILGNDVTIDLLLVDMHFLKGDMKAARADVEASLRSVGDDSYLFHLLGLMCIRTNDLPGAEAALGKAEKIEPDLIDLIDLRMMILAMQKNYPGLVKTMNDFAAETGAILTPDILAETVYDDFKKSPEFAQWAAGLKK
jgi:hypothetical protein